MSGGHVEGKIGGEGILTNHSNSELFRELVPRPELHEQPLTVPLEDAIDWTAAWANECERNRKTGSESGPRTYYVVVFRSIRLESADDEKLYTADALAHEEALKSGGLLGYSYGTLNERRECLAMCIWETREQALAARQLPAHMAAFVLAENMYKSYVLERYWLSIGHNNGAPIITPFSSVPSG